MHSHRPQITQAKLAQLRPTQMTVGMLEVRRKIDHWATLKPKARESLLQTQCFPAILGPAMELYIVDHHHLGRALEEQQVQSVWINVLHDLSWLEGDEFWLAMEHFQWARPFDRKGQRRSYKLMPKTISELKDDPFRSLAGQLRQMGGFAKDTSPFSEFLWADFPRRRVSSKLVESNFALALMKAKVLAHEQEARYLPGWSGTVRTV